MANQSGPVSKQGLLEISDVRGLVGGAPGVRIPPLGLGSMRQLGLSEDERNRIGREIGQGTLLLDKATRGQEELLLRLVASGPDRRLRFPFIATLRRFLAATASLDDAAAAALSDDALAKLWRDADEPTK
jgi:hypothetical protein